MHRSMKRTLPERHPNSPAMGFGLRVLLVFVLSLALAACDTEPSGQGLSQARDHLEQSDYAAAIIVLKNLVQDDPGSTEARWLLGKAHLGKGDAASAEKELAIARRLGWSENDVLPALAEALLAQRKNQDVLALDAFDLDAPAAGKVLAFQAVGAASLGRLDEAAGLIATALDTSPDSVDIQLAKARIHAIQAQFGEAAIVLGQLLEADGDNASAWALLGDVELGATRFEEALAAYDKTVLLAPDNYGALFRRALLAMELGRFQVAQADVGVLLREFPKHMGAHYIRGVLRFRSGKYAEAITSLSRAEPSADEFPMLLYFLSAAQLVDDQLESAIVNAGRFHQRAPQNIRGRLLYATALLKKSEYDKVEVLLRPVVDAEPDNVLALNLLSNALLRGGESEEAIDLLRRIAALQPESSVAQLRLGASLFLQGDNTQAERFITSALSLEPEFQQAEMMLVVNHLEQGNHEEAIAAALAYASKEGDSAASLNLLGRVYRAAGDPEKARAVFQQSLSLYPGEPTSNHNLAELALEANDFTRARSYYQEALEKNPTHLATLIQVARLDAKLNDQGALEKNLRTAMEAHPQALEPRVFLGRFYLSQQRPEKVLPLFANLEPLQKNLPQVLQLTARAQLAEGDYAAAKYAVSRLMEDAPDSPVLHHMLAAANAGLGDSSSTEASLRDTLELDAANTQARLALARLMLKQDRPEAFAAELAILEEQIPDSPALFGLRAQSSKRAGDIAQALVWSERAYEHGKNRDTVLALGELKGVSSDWAGAVSVFERWLVDHPADVPVMSALAHAYDQQGLEAESLAQYKNILLVDSDNADALNVLAWDLRHADTAEALQYARRASELAPRSAKALHTLALVEYIAENYRRAARAAERALDEDPNNLSLKYHSAMIDAARGEKTLAASKLRAVLRRGDNFPQIEQARALLAKVTE